MNLLCDRILSSHNYSIEIPEWLEFSEDINILTEAYEYHRGGKYECWLSDGDYTEHYTMDDKEWKEILRFYYQDVKGVKEYE